MGALAEPELVLASSILLSQVLSNVPFVILYVKALGANATAPTLALLAAGSTLAGGITFLGAASNIIVMQAAEKEGGRLPFREFTIAGVGSVAISMAAVLCWIRLAGL